MVSLVVVEVDGGGGRISRRLTNLFLRSRRRRASCSSRFWRGGVVGVGGVGSRGGSRGGAGDCSVGGGRSGGRLGLGVVVVGVVSWAVAKRVENEIGGVVGVAMVVVVELVEVVVAFVVVIMGVAVV